ncbi:Leucine-rich repeat domain superfamily [Sesbania bispinosa]|nr:Leucine-rich repeat domain superfamily [Sesbania bispinosa]
MSHTNSTSLILNTGVRVQNDENGDLISKLPDEILTNILSKLHIDEAVRCSVLSKRWEGLWKQTSHIEFDVDHMIIPMTKLLHSRALSPHPGSFLSKSKAEGVYRYGSVVFQLICHHSGDMSSCLFVHFQNRLSIGEVGIWVDLLVERKKYLKDLSLKCLPDLGEVSKLEISKPRFRCGVFDCLGSLEFIDYTIDFGYAFENCKKLKTLKLKRTHLDDETLSGILEICEALESLSLIQSTGFTRLIIRNSKLKVLQLHALWVDELGIYTPNLDVLSLDSTRCLLQNVSIYAPCLNTFRSYNYYILFARMSSFKEERSILRSHKVLSHWGDHLSVLVSFNAFTTSLGIDTKNSSGYDKLEFRRS